MQGIARLARDCDLPRTIGMLVLPVAAASARQLPAFALEKSDDLGDLQLASSATSGMGASATPGAKASAIRSASAARGAKCRYFIVVSMSA
jgi:hypothetical protein